MIEQDGFMWYLSWKTGELKKFCSVEEWEYRKKAVKEIGETESLEDKQALLEKAQKELRTRRKQRKSK